MGYDTAAADFEEATTAADDFQEATTAAVSPISELGRIDLEESDMIQPSIEVSSEGMVLDFEFDSTSSIAVSIVRDFGFARESNSMEGGVEFSALGLGVADELLDWSPLMAIAPSSNSLELALPVESDKDSQVLYLENSLEISRWVKYRILGFNKLVGLPLN